LPDFGTEAADQEASTKHGKHGGSPHPIAAGDQHKAEDQHNRSPHPVSRATELYSEQWKEK
jgi:hypothetical protein